jgi:hypothetical protein
MMPRIVMTVRLSAAMVEHGEYRLVVHNVRAVLRGQRDERHK